MATPTPAQSRLRPLIGWILVLGSIATLLLGFYRNQWHVVREKKFKEFQLDSESLVIGRLVESRQHGLLSHNALLGWGDANPLDLNQSDYDHQYETYLTGRMFSTYSLYKSASGAQALIFGVLQQLSPFEPAIDLRNFRALVAVLLAITIGSFIAWVYLEFGWFTALTLALSTILSQWITLFGRNLFYFIWASFVPLTLSAWYLHRSARRGIPYGRNAGWIGFAAILFKCLTNGYDFIIPALAMPAIPLIYYAARDAWPWRLLLRSVGGMVLAITLAVGASLLVLAYQLQTSEGSFINGLTSIVSTFGRRTYADPVLFPAYAESLRANPWSVLWTYIKEDTAIAILGFRFLDLILLTGLLTLLYLLLVKRNRGDQKPAGPRSRALIIAAWVSLLSPLSWFFLFKGQAYVHTHTNYLAWHMPFALFAYALCAWLAQQLITWVFRAVPARVSSRHGMKL